MRDEIENVYSRYGHGLDCGDFDLVARSFLPDVVFEVDDAYRATGRDAVLDRVRSRHRQGRTHVTSNILLEPTAGGTVSGRASFVVLSADAEIEACGEYHDVLAQDDDGHWAFASRRITYRSPKLGGNT